MRSPLRTVTLLLAAASILPLPAFAQTASRKPLDPAPAAAPHRTRLILKDGSYQLVMGYQIKGTMVSYVSAERGSTEELPADLVDWDATHKWEQRHAGPPDPGSDSGQAAPPVIDPELLKDEADRAALTPEVAPNLTLPEQDSVVALDEFRGTPELVPLIQSDGELNRTTGHNILKLSLNPRAASHQIVQLKGVESPIQFHVDAPVIYLRIGDDSGIHRGGTPLTVDTHGASGGPTPPAASASSGYVIVRADVRTDARVLASFNISAVSGSVQRQEEVIETSTELLPGGHWMRITPRRPLDFGEYALMEVLSDREVNLSVWDFGVHPGAPENKDVIKPQPKRPITLERRGRPD